MIWIILGIIATAGMIYYFTRNKKKEEKFSFGIIADVHRRGMFDNDGIRLHSSSSSSSGSSSNYCRTFAHIEEAVNDFNSMDLSFVIQLGDFIDPHPVDEAESANCLRDLMPYWNNLNCNKFHVLGNHDAHISDFDIRDIMGMDKKYYDFAIDGIDVRFVVMDQNDAGKIGEGGIGPQQSSWLHEVLNDCDESNTTVVIFGHYPILKRASGGHSMLNPQPIMDLIKCHPSVAVYIAGHTHAYHYGFEDGVHHVSIHGMLEDENGYAVVDVTPKHLTINGIGAMSSVSLPYDSSMAVVTEC